MPYYKYRKLLFQKVMKNILKPPIKMFFDKKADLNKKVENYKLKKS